MRSSSNSDNTFRVDASRKPGDKAGQAHGQITTMLKNGVRHCDVCDKEIAKGYRYFAALVERDFIPPNANIPGSGLTVDALGNVTLDVCLECRHAVMSLRGEERVN